MDYFTKLFKSETCHNDQFLTPANFPAWKQHEYQMLCNPFGKKEVRDAVFGMGPYKAPGPNGFQPLFYQQLQDTVGNDLVNVVECLNKGILPKELNQTLLVLIPKIEARKTMKQFRPISLCNVA